jgi:response regulator RpfG family c-di-GMP phosphodiesterase
MPSSASPIQSVGEILARAGAITAEDRARAEEHARQEGSRIEEAVLDLGLMEEGALLKALSAQYGTQFVSTAQLAKAAIDKPTLGMIPKRVAEMLGVFPVIFDAATSTLSVVTADPSDNDMLRNVQSVSGVKTVKAFVARPRAVLAAIARAHTGDLQAFARLEMEAAGQLHGMLDVRSTFTRGETFGTEPSSRVMRPGAAVQRETARQPPPGPKKPPELPTAAGRGGRREAETREALDEAPPELGSLGPPPIAAAAPGERASGYTLDELLDLLNVLISLLENTRADLRGHSAQVARLLRRVVERMNLPARTVTALVAAAYTHDLGKMGQFHLTALNASEYDGHKLAAQKTLRTPGRLLEGVRLPAETMEANLRMYERHDGKGFPDGLAGKEIPVGARILAIVDTYADLTQNPRNPYRKALSPAEACGVLVKFKGTVFDPDVVDLFQSVVMGEDIKARLLADRYVALLVDPDPEETTVLELRMIEQGFEVKTARNAEQATKILSESKIDLVVSEVELPQQDGLSLLETARNQPWGKDVAWVMHSRRQGRAEAQRAFELGVLDYVGKPTATDVLVAKLKARLDTRRAQKGSQATSGGVSGSLKEMGLPDMVQVLFHGRKTGNLRITTGSQSGEIHFQDGAVVNAAWGSKKGVNAFYDMIRLTDGQFALDPSFKPTERVIHESAEALLLEGMRRLDEGLT